MHCKHNNNAVGKSIFIKIATSVPDNNFCSLYSGILISISATSKGVSVISACLINL